MTWLAGVSNANTAHGDGTVEMSPGAGDATIWIRGKIGKWMEEGSKRVEKVGLRYGILGFEKRVKGAPGAEVGQDPRQEVVKDVHAAGTGQTGVAEKVASAIAAYVAVKASDPNCSLGVKGSGAC